MATTATQLISSSLRLIGSLSAGEEAQAEDSADALAVFNQLLDSLSNESLLVHEKSRDTYTLTASQNPHTLGPSGADLMGPRPLKVESAGIIESGESTEYPITLVDHYRWARISNKSTASNFPDLLWVEKEPTSVKLWLYPVCSAANTLVLYTWKQLVSGLVLTTELAYPPGYERMLRFNLALDLAVEFKRQVPPEIGRIAKSSKSVLKGTNSVTPVLRIDPGIERGGGSDWDIVSGDYLR